MASLTASDPNEIALVSSPTSGTATFHVDPTGSGASVETWERDFVFGAVTSPPPFVNTGTFSAIANVARAFRWAGFIRSVSSGRIRVIRRASRRIPAAFWGDSTFRAFAAPRASTS